uniref:5-hydroxytryptamine receptor 7 n=1 Tax=Podarcis muralis TaxID=64176 RepID=A0A670HNK4_PODMU
MVLDVHGAGSCPLVSSPRRCFAPHAPRQLGSGGAAAAAMISGSLHPPRLGIGGKLLQGVTASPGGSGHAGSGSGVGSGAGSGSSSPSPGFGDVGNDTQCGEQILSYGNVEKVVIGAALSLITLLTIAGNCLVVISVCFVKKLRQPSNYLIVSLALADLSVAVAVMPFVSVTDLIGGEWIFGSFFCNVFIAMDVMCCTASIMTLCVISIDSGNKRIYLDQRHPWPLVAYTSAGVQEAAVSEAGRRKYKQRTCLIWGFSSLACHDTQTYFGGSIHNITSERFPLFAARPGCRPFPCTST